MKKLFSLLVAAMMTLVVYAGDQTTIWEGDVNFGTSWSANVTDLSGEYDWSDVEVGDLLHFTCIYNSDDSWGGLIPKDASWAEIPSAPQYNFTVAQGQQEIATYEVSEDFLAVLQNGGLIIQGYNFSLLKVDWESQKTTIVTETSAEIWTGETNFGTSWSANVTDLSGEYDWSAVEVGDSLLFYCTYNSDDSWGGLIPKDASWAEIPSAPQYNFTVAQGEDEVAPYVINEDFLAVLQNGGLIIQGYNFTLNKVVLKTIRKRVIIEKFTEIWTGETNFGTSWSANVTDLSGEYDWSAVEAGDSLLFYCTYNSDDSWGGLIPKDASWAEIPSAPQYNFTVAQGEDEVAPYVINEDFLAVLQNGGLIIQGYNFTLNKVVLHTIRELGGKDTIFENRVIIENEYVEYNGGEEVYPEILVFNPDSTKVLAVDKDYVLTGKNNTELGAARFIVTGKGNYVGEVEKAFTIVAKNVTAEMVTVQASVPFYGEAVTPEVEIIWGLDTLEAGVDYDATFENNDAVGTANYTLVFRGKYTGTLTGTFEVVEPLTLTAEMVTLEADTFVYTREEIVPAVTLVFGEDTLVEGVDYEVAYAENLTITDSAKVHIAGLGYYTGEIETTFVIAAKEIEEKDITLAEYIYLYEEGKTFEPMVTVMHGEAALVEGKEYTVEYIDNTKAGDAYARIAGIANYAGTVDVKFVLQEAKQVSEAGIALVETKFTYTGEEIKPAVTNVGNMVEGNHYTLAYVNNINVTNDSVKAFVVVEGKYAFAGNDTLYFEIEAKELTAENMKLEAEKFVYAGDTVRPVVEVKDGDKVLAEGTDYTVWYANNGTITVDTVAYAYVAAMGNYTSDTIALEFAIVGRAAIDSIATIEAQVYSTEAIEPEVTVLSGETELKKDEDYVVIYSNNINATDSAKVEVIGIGFYCDTLTTYFAISKKVLTEEDVTIAADTITYSIAAMEPAVKVMNGEVELEAGKVYEVKYTDNDAANKTGKAIVTILDTENYETATFTREFYILPMGSATLTIALAETEYTYAAKVYEPAVIVTDGETVLAKGSDYTYVYEDNEEVGTAKVIVTFDGNYTGEETATFEIKARELTAEMVIMSGSDFKYTGEAIVMDPVVIDAELDYILKLNVDYEIEYSNNVEPGYASIFITGMGHYTGRVRQVFYIEGEGIQNMKNANAASLYIKDGKLFIERAARIYDAQGRLVK